MRIYILNSVWRHSAHFAIYRMNRTRLSRQAHLFRLQHWICSSETRTTFETSTPSFWVRYEDKTFKIIFKSGETHCSIPEANEEEAKIISQRSAGYAEPMTHNTLYHQHLRRKCPSPKAIRSRRFTSCRTNLAQLTNKNHGPSWADRAVVGHLQSPAQRP